MNQSGSTFFTKKNIIILLLAVIMLSAGAFLFIKNGIINSHGKDGNASDGSSDTELPDLAVSAPIKEVYYDESADDPLKYVTERSDFSAVATVSDSYNTTHTTTYFVTSFEGKFRIENVSSLIIFDGIRLYVETPEYTLVNEAADYDLFTELGTLSLKKLKEKIAHPHSNAALTVNGTDIIVSFYDENKTLTEEYVVTPESGIVIEEKLLSGYDIRKSCSFRNITYLTEKDIQTETFKIPD